MIGLGYWDGKVIQNCLRLLNFGLLWLTNTLKAEITYITIFQRFSNIMKNLKIQKSLGSVSCGELSLFLLNQFLFYKK